MANEQNIKPYEFTSEQSREEAAKNGAKGGRRSGEVRRQKRDLRRALENLLEKDFVDKNGMTVSGTDAIAARLFEQAMRGNIRAFQTLRDTVGQKPIEKVMVAEVDQDVIDEVERIVFEDE